jgi:hypothetical protein
MVIAQDGKADRNTRADEGVLLEEQLFLADVYEYYRQEHNQPQAKWFVMRCKNILLLLDRISYIRYNTPKIEERMKEEGR